MPPTFCDIYTKRKISCYLYHNFVTTTLSDKVKTDNLSLGQNLYLAMVSVAFYTFCSFKKVRRVLGEFVADSIFYDL